jgi:predicted acylesterase/phospholipase RssA
MDSRSEVSGPLGRFASDHASPDGLSRSNWFSRMRQFWPVRSSRPAASAARPPSLASPDLTAFVLLGGGARGAAQAGALAAALELGVRPDVIIGVSAGAWNGAYLAVDPTPERARALCAIWAGLKTSDLLGGGWWRAAVSAASGRPSLYSAAGPLRVAHRYMDKQLFEELKAPLHILAANLTTGQPTLFSSGRILPAVLASSAVPGIFPPVALDGQVYVDGGLLEWGACAEALRLGARRIYLFGCGAVGELPSRLILSHEMIAGEEVAPSNGKTRLFTLQKRLTLEQTVGANLLEVLERSWDVVSQYQFQRAVEGLRAGGASVISIEPLLPPLSRPLDFSRSESVIAAGRAAAEAALGLELPDSLLTARDAADRHEPLAESLSSGN